MLSYRAAFSLLCVLFLAFLPALASTSTPSSQSSSSSSSLSTTIQHQKRQVLHSIRRTLESYSDLAIKRMLGPNSIHSVNIGEDSEDGTTSTTTEVPSTTSTDSAESPLRGVFRVRADLTSSSVDEEITPTTRHRRHRHSEWGRSSGHKRRRKGCPPMHGKDQLLCPSRNSHRYDVCISREQLCDHIVDCPDGEDEDPRQCFFYKPLDDQLKTLSHAVLLLVDNVMADGLNRNEL